MSRLVTRTVDGGHRVLVDDDLGTGHNCEDSVLDLVGKRMRSTQRQVPVELQVKLNESKPARPPSANIMHTEHFGALACDR